MKAPTVKSFKELYHTELKAKLQSDLSIANVMAVPRLEKITLNMGVGEAVADSKVVTSACNDLTLIAGQKAVITKARLSIATFKLREGMQIGCKVTLRGERMYEFLERLVLCTLPGLRDFRGLNTKSFDGNGNYSLGIKEHVIFPEIEYDKVDQIRGIDITIVTSTSNDNYAKALLKGFHLPFIN